VIHSTAVCGGGSGVAAFAAAAASSAGTVESSSTSASEISAQLGNAIPRALSTTSSSVRAAIDDVLLASDTSGTAVAPARMDDSMSDNTAGREGVLMAHGPEPLDLARRASSYVDPILRGARASELPIQYPTKFERWCRDRG
jgi:putative tryptophan/tyrosine transport system substrate-binding protein